MPHLSPHDIQAIIQESCFFHSEHGDILQKTRSVNYERTRINSRVCSPAERSQEWGLSNEPIWPKGQVSSVGWPERLRRLAGRRSASRSVSALTPLNATINQPHCFGRFSLSFLKILISTAFFLLIFLSELPMRNYTFKSFSLQKVSQYKSTVPIAFNFASSSW